MQEYVFSMAETLSLSIVLLLAGRWVKSKISFFNTYFIPAPVIGGLMFACVTLAGHSTQTFSFTFDASLSGFLMTMFFTSVGFMASVQLLSKGGVQVFVFLGVATVLIGIQNGIGVALAHFFSIDPLIGIATGSVPLTGGHGTSGAFGPVLEAAGAAGATTVAVAAATYGLVAGCMIGGPIAKRLMVKYNLTGNSQEEFFTPLVNIHDDSEHQVSERSTANAIFTLVITMGIGAVIGRFLGKFITLPVYIGPMIAAAVIRNLADAYKNPLPMYEISVAGNISLTVFLSITLMSMRLWELATLAVPMIVILLAQTIVMALFAYYVTFFFMGKDYDAAVMASGHCGFGLGATPNAMANMESFTSANGPSPKAFMVIPLVGALFIDFTNALVITFFINLLK